MDHECIIGLYYYWDGDSLITLNGLKYNMKRDEEIKKIAEADPVYASIYLRKTYDFADYFDKRKSVNMKRFEYCPTCGKKINWKKLRSEYLANKD